MKFTKVMSLLCWNLGSLVGLCKAKDYSKSSESILMKHGRGVGVGPEKKPWNFVVVDSDSGVDAGIFRMDFFKLQDIMIFSSGSAKGMHQSQ